MSVVNYKIEDEICLIEVNNPPVNAISVEVRKGLLDAVIDLEQNKEIKAVLICAPNRTFWPAQILENLVKILMDQFYLTFVTV